MKGYLKILPVLLVCLALVACKGKTMVKQDMAGEAPMATAEETVMVPEGEAAAEEVMTEDLGAYEAEKGDASMAASAEAAVMGLATVHFDFDRYFIRETDKKILRNNARWLKEHSGVKVVIEGHADERGENEYNLALAEKRAMSVKNYLKSLGVNQGRLSTLSYGEERPADPGHNEAAWAKNRRADFRTGK
jgi:peptidoglycan-associated lipoprotein